MPTPRGEPSAPRGGTAVEGAHAREVCWHGDGAHLRHIRRTSERTDRFRADHRCRVPIGCRRGRVLPTSRDFLRQPGRPSGRGKVDKR